MAVGALGVRIAVGKSSFHQTSSGCNCSSRETISGGKTRFRTSHQPPLPPPLPPPPRRHSRNRCPCGECFARPEFNTPGDCSFRAKAAVAVEAVTNAIAITSGGSPRHRLHQPLPHRRRRNCYNYDKSGGRCDRGSVNAKLLLLGGAEALREGGNRGVAGGGAGRRDGLSARPLLSGERGCYGRARAEA